jgi:hypothetical protein
MTDGDRRAVDRYLVTPRTIGSAGNQLGRPDFTERLSGLAR